LNVPFGAPTLLRRTRGTRAVLATGLATLGLLATGAGILPGASPARAASPPAQTQAGQRYVIDPATSEALYHVGETFLNRGNAFKMAVGTTHDIQGEILIDRVRPQQSRIGPITVNISQLTSDSRRRDNAIRRRWLESAAYPTAVFTPTSIQGLPSAYVDGRAIPVRIAGNLHVRDVTKPVTFGGTVMLTGDILTGDATTTVLMTDFGFEPPSILGFLTAENRAQLEIKVTARRAP
jgi:polyisoprenoid-binding protein YceI